MFWIHDEVLESTGYEEPLDEVARLVESGAEANRILAV